MSTKQQSSPLPDPLDKFSREDLLTIEGHLQRALDAARLRINELNRRQKRRVVSIAEYDVQQVAGARRT